MYRYSAGRLDYRTILFFDGGWGWGVGFSSVIWGVENGGPRFLPASGMYLRDMAKHSISKTEREKHKDSARHTTPPPPVSCPVAVLFPIYCAAFVNI
jgi:hypothetical protein